MLAYYYPRDIDRVPVIYSQIAPVMRQAIVAIEDSRFYKHGAIDFRGTVRALVNNLEHKSVQGGSTLAQQYVKNVEILSAPDPEKAFASATADTVGRKIRELRMAVQVEHTMSKNQILAGYLNAAFFGNQSYGIETAAERYFSIPAAKLTLPQAAMLAGIVENPSAYNPLGNATEVQTTLTRRNTVLARMAQLHDISPAIAAAAEKSKLGLNPSLPQSGCTSKSAKYAGYLCDYVVAVIHHGQILYDGPLTGLADQFAAHKTIGVALEDGTVDLTRYGEVIHRDGDWITLRVPKTETSEIASRLLAEQSVLDLTIEEPPIEDVIELVFAQERREPEVEVVA